MLQVGKFAKFYTAVGGGIVTALTAIYPSTLHWLPALGAGLTAALVYLVPNATASDTSTVKPATETKTTVIGS